MADLHDPLILQCIENKRCNMIEIKFRAIELNGNRRLGFVFGYLVDIATSNDRNRGWRIVTTFPTAITYTPVDGTTVGQYTGLKDRNGKEIYEGDILRCSKYLNIYSPVYFYSGCFCTDEATLSDLLMYRTIEVIGNIYENTELIS